MNYRMKFTLKPEKELSRPRKNLFMFVALSVIIFITYSNTFDVSWQFDDDVTFLENKKLLLTEINTENIINTLFSQVKANGEKRLYRPVSCLTLALNYYFGGKDVFGYHIVNTIVHILSAFFLYLFILKILNLPLIRDKYGSNAYPIAVFASLLWALNPVQTQAITYIVQRMASMAGMFFIMSMYFYVRGRTAADSPKKLIFFLTCFVAGILAVGSKQNAAMLPISIWLLDLLLIQGVSRQNLKINGIILSFLLLIPLALALVMGDTDLFSLDWLISGFDDRPFTLTERLLTGPRILIFYISLLLYPIPQRLCLTHDITVSRSLFDPATTFMAILFIIVLLAITVIKSKKYPLFSFCIFFFFLNHIIESSIFPLELIFEHRNYVPSMFLFVPIVIGFMNIQSHFYYNGGLRILLAAFSVIILILLGHSAYMRNHVWKTPESLWLDSIYKYPEMCRPYNNLGKYYSDMGFKRKALDLFLTSLDKRSIPSKKRKYLAFYNIGLGYMFCGNTAKALDYFNKAEDIFPNYSLNLNNKGFLLLQKGKTNEAARYFKLAIAGAPEIPNPFFNLGKLELKTGQIDKAVQNLSKAVSLGCTSSTNFKYLAHAYRLKENSQKARFWFQKALKAGSKDAKIYLYLAEAYFAIGNSTRADKYIYQYINKHSREGISEYIKGYTAHEKIITSLKPLKKMVLLHVSGICQKEADRLLEEHLKIDAFLSDQQAR